MFSEDTKDGTAIDGMQRKVVGTIHVGGKPEEAVSDDQGHLYIDVQDKDVVLKVDAKKLAVTEKWPVGQTCHEPASLAIDVPNQRIFVGCRNQVMIVMDTSNGHVITTLPIGEVTDAAEYDPQGNIIFSSNIDGTITVIHEESPNKYTVVDNVKTEFGARTMALDLKTHRLFMILADRSNIPARGTASQHLRPVIIPNTFHVLVVGKE
jgi:DNA-binding beta-propeller fold protein YncE